MSQLIEATKINESYMKIDAPAGVRDELHDFFSFYMDGYRFAPAYKHKIWDGKVRLYNRITKQIMSGLLPYVQSFAQDREYILHVDPQLEQKNTITEDELYSFSEQLKLSLNPRDYQIQAIKYALENLRTVILSPTSSGKSLIIYILLRYLQANLEDFKALLIVPTVGLVEQMTSDFVDYSQNDDK